MLARGESAMARVILIHGIAQEQSGAAQQEQLWLPSLADGLRAAGHPTLADQIWPDHNPRQIDIRMAYYGNLFIDPNAQGADTDLDDLTPEQLDIAAELAEVWLGQAVERPDHPDHDTATLEAGMLNHPGQTMGAKEEFARAALQATGKLRWFAVGGMAFAERFVNKSLRQVTLYLTDPDLRQKIQDRVLPHLDDTTQIIIGHSLGSVIAYEIAANHLTQTLPLLLTLGSPLGLRSIVYDRTQPQPPTFPGNVNTWVNISDRNDLIAADPDLTPLFPGATPTQIQRSEWIIDNGNKPHDATHYLGKRQVGQSIAEALSK